MKITRDEVNRIARLARLSLADAEADAMTKQLDAILEYVAQLQSLDTTGVEPTSQVGGTDPSRASASGPPREAATATPMREDEPRESLPQDVALASAPKSAGGGFVVPKTVDVG